MSVTNRNIVAIYFTFALQSLGQAISWQFGTYFLKDELGVLNFVMLTVIWSIPSFVTILAVNFWGATSDRRGRRKPFMTIGFAGFSGTFLLLSFVQSSMEFLLITAAGAVFSAAAIPAGQALATTATEKKGERLGWMLVAQSAGWFVGAFGSGFLYDIIGMFNLYRIAGLVCILATVICALVVKDVTIAPSEIRKRSSTLTILRIPGMARLAMAAGMSSMGIVSITSLMAIMIVDELGGATAYVGLANASATLLAVFITGYIGKVIDQRGPAGILMGAYASYAIFAVGFALVGDPLAAALLYALPIYPLSNTAAYAFAALLSGDEERGSAMGLVNGAQNAGNAIGPLVGGFFAEYIFLRVQPVSWINMVFNLVALLFAISLVPIAYSLHNKSIELTDIDETEYTN
ncbi:MAG: MFS transporter [Candidatus Thorarchaeota archaeon]|nr:MFS transporter [Candidatus Thorarchaeota archaeon]